MWLFCGGMPRSGSTLQFQLTAHLVEQAGLGARVEWVRADEFPRLRDRHAGGPGWKVFKTHTCTPEVQAEFAAGNARGVYVFRDVRDVVVSRMRKRDQSFAEVWQARFLDRILANFERWTALDAVLVSQYEHMVEDLAGEVARIAAHLGIAIDRSTCAEVASAYTVARQRERIREAEAAGRLRTGGDGDVHYDPVSNLHAGHIRSGRPGEWRSVLAPEEVALVEARARDWLGAHGYPLSLSGWGRLVLKLRPRRRQQAGEDEGGGADRR